MIMNDVCLCIIGADSTWPWGRGAIALAAKNLWADAPKTPHMT